MDAWQGNVMDGITLCARIVLAPRSRRELRVGQLAVSMASGRTPSSMMKITGGMEDSFNLSSLREASSVSDDTVLALAMTRNSLRGA
jgi:hypothetical protein